MERIGVVGWEDKEKGSCDGATMSAPPVLFDCPTDWSRKVRNEAFCGRRKHANHVCNNMQQQDSRILSRAARQTDGPPPQDRHRQTTHRQAYFLLEAGSVKLNSVCYQSPLLRPTQQAA